jgi:class 3 adenylate cyclase
MNRETQLDNLYGQLKGIREMCGTMTAQTCKDFNWIVERLGDLGVLTPNDMHSFRVADQLTWRMEQAETSGIPERAVRLIGVLDHHNQKTIDLDDGALLRWAIQDGIPLAVVFSDVSKGVMLCNQLGDTEWQRILQEHFALARNLARENDGFFVKEIGDGLMALFHDAVSALDFTIALRVNSGGSQFVLHQGAHIGKVIVKQNDAVGINVDLANRVANYAQGGMIVVTDEFWKDIQRIKSPAHAQLPSEKLASIPLKGFEETFVLWQV